MPAGGNWVMPDPSVLQEGGGSTGGEVMGGKMGVWGFTAWGMGRWGWC